MKTRKHWRPIDSRKRRQDIIGWILLSLSSLAFVAMFAVAAYLDGWRIVL